MRVFWKRQDAVTDQLRTWNAGALLAAIEALDGAMRRVRGSPLGGDAVARTALWRIARHATRTPARLARE